VHIAEPNATNTARAACARLVDFLPAVLDGLRSRVVAPRSPLVHAWGSPPVLLRCGVPEPNGYSPDSAQTASVDGVIWFQQIQTDVVDWTAIRNSADIEVVVPKKYAGQGGFLAELARPIRVTIR
jgi:hypothetical protein